MRIGNQATMLTLKLIVIGVLGMVAVALAGGGGA